MSDIFVHPFIALQNPLTIEPDAQVQLGPVKPAIHPVHVVVELQVLQPTI